MFYSKLKSWAKINLSLHVIKKLPNNYNSIESLITFAQIYDEIKIRTIFTKHNKISFSGKFSKGISKNNTIIKLLNLLEKKKLIKKNFELKLTKNIPQKSGMGGGSMNAACILKYLIKKNFLIISMKKANKLAYKIGADVALGLEKKNSILFKNGRIARVKNKMNFYVLITKPKFGCSTESIFSKVSNYSKPSYVNVNKSFFQTKNLVKAHNDLENIVFKKYLIIKKLKYFLLSLPNVLFARMTGTGSAMVAYFNSKNAAKKAAKIFKSKYRGYWCVVSKTI